MDYAGSRLRFGCGAVVRIPTGAYRPSDGCLALRLESETHHHQKELFRGYIWLLLLRLPLLSSLSTYSSLKGGVQVPLHDIAFTIDLMDESDAVPEDVQQFIEAPVPEDVYVMTRAVWSCAKSRLGHLVPRKV